LNQQRRRARRIPGIVAMLATGGAMMLSSLPSAAQQVAQPGYWYSAGLVTRVHPGDGSGYFSFSTAIQYAMAACTTNAYGYMFPESSAAVNRNFALLLTAYTTGKPVSIHFTGACSGGAAGRPVVDTIEITDVPYN
jgi:hypothetical protein